MSFDDELKFEQELINILYTSKGWEKDVLKYKTEDELLENWANILFENNRDKERLDEYPLTKGEMDQIIEQINTLKTPMRLNSFINGRFIQITRDNPDDIAHFGKIISLKIYDRQEIAAGQSRYQIVEQPIFKPKDNNLYPARRGDFLLLINGMPLIHVELKKSGVPVSKAINQIEKYAYEGVFTGLFSLVQIFVAMNPEETKYFANPGPDGKFNPDYQFHWADFNNVPINDYKEIAYRLLSIPMAHEMIGFYTVADGSDGCLKVLRSYQYYAASRISKRVSEVHWEDKELYGGYVWHTTGSGKTMTSFKSAQLIANSKDADKVVFLMDRIELGTQSLEEYRNFADESQEVQATEDTYILLNKLKSSNPLDTLIVTSIQKMSNIKEESAYNQNDIALINRKRVVFIIDECHRSTFGDMLTVIKQTFPRAIFFGFTGTPIEDENKKKDSTTSMVFGNEIHRYTISDGIRDKNVLGFDQYKVTTYKDKDLRQAVALDKANAKTVEEVYANEKKKEVFEHYMDPTKVHMITYIDKNKKIVRGIEDYISSSQYDREEHRKKVIEDIMEQWLILSKNGKYHAILATSSIAEACEYYKLLKKKDVSLKFTALFDKNYDKNDGQLWKEDAIVEILTDYNSRYKQNYKLSDFGKFKKDVCLRLAHKKPYQYIANDKDLQIDLLIVVDQMLTGFDSKWLNTLYLDKTLKYEGIIQAFSRTNRLNGPDKPFGVVRYYRKPHTMERQIEKAFSLYSGGNTFGIFTDKLEKNIEGINRDFAEIKDIFDVAGIINFEKLPNTIEEIAKFASSFRSLNYYLEAAKIQGFTWRKSVYQFKDKNESKYSVSVLLDEQTYNILLQRYKEIPRGGGVDPEAPYDIEGYLTEIDTGVIDTDWLNSRFTKYLVALQTGENIDKARNEVHKTFATLSQEEQKYANMFLADIEIGKVVVQGDKTLREYITEYQTRAKNDQIHEFASTIGINEDMLRELIKLNLSDSNINEYGKFDALMNTLDKNTAKAYFDKNEETSTAMFMVSIKANKLVREFLLHGGFEI